MAIQFITDSSADLSCEYLKEHNIHLIPMVYQMNDQEYLDSPFTGEHILTRKEFYDAMRAGGQPKTSQINEMTYTEAFEKILSAGDDAFYIGISGGLTGSLNNARLASEALKEKYPDRTVYLVDSLGAAIGEGVLVMLGIKAYEEGKSGAEIKAFLDEARFHILYWFTVEDLVYLKRGGRISAATAAVGTMLNIKPMLNFNDEGHLVALENARGRKKAIRSLVSHLVEKGGADFSGDIYMVHSDSSEADIQMLRTLVQEQFGRDVASVTNLTSIIGSHTGPGLLALIAYIPDARR